MFTDSLPQSTYLLTLDCLHYYPQIISPSYQDERS